MKCLGLALAYVAVVAFALSMAPHHRTVFGTVPKSAGRRGLRLAGTIMLGASAAAFLAGTGWPLALVTWLAALSVSAFGVTLLLAYGPRLLPVAAALLLLAALGAALSGS